jgi:uncharacterized membrane protein
LRAVPDFQATLLAIVVMTIATYFTRVAGYFLGRRIVPGSLASRVLEVLPGAALSGVLALSLVQLPVVDVLAVGVAVLVYLWSGQTLLGIATGLLIAVANAHFFS